MTNSQPEKINKILYKINKKREQLHSELNFTITINNSVDEKLQKNFQILEQLNDELELVKTIKESLKHKTLRNRFEIVKHLGSGGSADTYLAVDVDLPGQPHCVVKHFHPKDANPAVLPIAKKLFEREAEVLYQLGNDHNQIPRLFAHFNEDGDFYLVQEFIDGHALTQEIVPGQRLSENAVLNLLKDILEVLAFVHQHNIIHRDIKPQNLMRRHSDQKIVLIDFGSIKKIGALGAGLTIAVGTPGYMPSEQAKGKPKLCSDIYAVGMIGIQALTGLIPEQLQEDPNTGEVIWRDQAQVSDALANVLDTMVRDRHSQRYQSAAEALQALYALTYILPTQLDVFSDLNLQSSRVISPNSWYWNVRENIAVFFDPNKSLYHTWQKSKYIIAFACGGAFLGSLIGSSSVSILGALIGTVYGFISQKNNIAVAKTYFTGNEIYCQESIFKGGGHMIALASGGAFLGGLISQTHGSVVGGIIGAILSLITNV
ncbi:MAG: serine/threonine-protein kinase [Nostoc sp.]|uniref:serine/threonine-protein kinase n=1 Tax=Nostoc sp. TaxID=1180 RepID=UPI002FF6540B